MNTPCELAAFCAVGSASLLALVVIWLWWDRRNALHDADRAWAMARLRNEELRKRDGLLLGFEAELIRLDRNLQKATDQELHQSFGNMLEKIQKLRGKA